MREGRRSKIREREGGREEWGVTWGKEGVYGGRKLRGKREREKWRD